LIAIILISTENVKPYTKSQHISTFPKTYQDALITALALARTWDANAELLHAGGTVSCNKPDSLERVMIFEFGTSVFYYGLPRVSYANVNFDPENNQVIIVAETTDSYGQPATLNPDTITVNLNEALAIAQASGGETFMNEHPQCFIGFSHFDHIWHFRYAADLNDYQNNNLRFEIDSRTGDLIYVGEKVNQPN
jgi:hypothetical protein